MTDEDFNHWYTQMDGHDFKWSLHNIKKWPPKCLVYMINQFPNSEYSSLALKELTNRGILLYGVLHNEQK